MIHNKFEKSIINFTKLIDDQNYSEITCQILHVNLKSFLFYFVCFGFSSILCLYVHQIIIRTNSFFRRLVVIDMINV